MPEPRYSPEDVRTIARIYASPGTAETFGAYPLGLRERSRDEAFNLFDAVRAEAERRNALSPDPTE